MNTYISPSSFLRALVVEDAAVFYAAAAVFYAADDDNVDADADDVAAAVFGRKVGARCGRGVGFYGTV